MIVTRLAQDWLQVVRKHRRVAGAGFILGVFVWLGIGELYPKKFTGTATLAVNPQHPAQASSALISGAEYTPSVALIGALRQTEARIDWTAIVNHWHLYPDLVVSGGDAAAAKYLASQIALQPVSAPDLGTEAVRFTFTGDRLEKVSGVIDSLVNSFTTVTQKSAAPTKAADANDPLYAPVVLPDQKERSELQRGKHRSAEPRAAVAGLTPEVISLQLQASLDRGATLQQAAQQNQANLAQLQQDYQAAEQRIKAAEAAPPAVVRKPDPQEERLHQELTRAQSQLAALRERYTDEYPDVVTARQKVQDIELDISRIAAIAPPASKPQTIPSSQTAKQAGSELERIADQINQAEAAQNNLRDSIDKNDEETAHLRNQLAAASRSEATSTPNVAASLPAPVTHGKEQKSAPLSMKPEPLMVPQFFVVHPTSVETHPAIFAVPLLLSLSLVFGACAALFAAWLAERHDPSIRNEGMLRHELPASAVYLGGIPRIKHEIITE